MGLRFRKSINLGKIFRINLSRSGIGYSWGVKGFRSTRTSTGKKRNTFSIPGTGISYVKELKENSTKTNDESKGKEMKKKRKIAPYIVGFLILGAIGSLGKDPEEPKEQPTEIQSLASNVENNEKPTDEATSKIEEPKTEEQSVSAVVTPPIVVKTAEQPTVEQPVTEQPTAEDIIVYVTNSGTKYHRSGCRHLNDSKYETTLTKALSQGYTACGTCNPPSQ